MTHRRSTVRHGPLPFVSVHDGTGQIRSQGGSAPVGPIRGNSVQKDRCVLIQRIGSALRTPTHPALHGVQHCSHLSSGHDVSPAVLLQAQHVSLVAADEVVGSSYLCHRQ
jgi:hypothetical protein